MTQPPMPPHAPVGRRQIVTYNTTGQPNYATQDLTPADFLDPQPGDEFFQGDAHGAMVDYLARCLRHLYRYNPFVGVLVGAKMVWDDPTLAQPMPDIAVVANLADPHRFRDRLDVAAEGTRPRCIFEVTSPQLAALDLVDKRDLYGCAQVQEYFIVEPTPLRITAYRLENGSYRPLAPDAQGRIYSATNKVWFAPDDAHGLALIEERTGHALVPPDDPGEPQTATQVDAAIRAQSIASKLNLGR